MRYRSLLSLAREPEDPMDAAIPYINIVMTAGLIIVAGPLSSSGIKFWFRFAVNGFLIMATCRVGPRSSLPLVLSW